MIFSTKYTDIVNKIQQINPSQYAATRNYLNGAVTYLSPYISRGVINPAQIVQLLNSAGIENHAMEKFIQELCWREYWQLKWKLHGNDIDNDLKHAQPKANKFGIPKSIVEGSTGIIAIDNGIKEFYKTGYLHNHLRMYIASLACNIAQCHWKIPATWMYYYLLDADWASNALSWQWVCGANSDKLYFANQENIYKYCGTNQINSFLDINYEAFNNINIPNTLEEIVPFNGMNSLPEICKPNINPQLPTIIYNFYNIDPLWKTQIEANRILLLEPSVFQKYPVSKNSIEFCIQLATDNIDGIQICVCEFSDIQLLTTNTIYYKQHPLNNYTGVAEEPSLLVNAGGDYPSFFAYWKKCRKTLI